MKTNTTLYLLPEEAAVFAKLSDGLREGWEVKTEVATAFESAEVLKVRASMARFDLVPELKAFVETLMKGGKPDSSKLKSIPESALPEFFFTIGAQGVTALLRVLLAQTKTDNDVKGLAGFSHIRHDILETNASISLV